jgi:hypothetical protein
LTRVQELTKKALEPLTSTQQQPKPNAANPSAATAPKDTVPEVQSIIPDIKQYDFRQPNPKSGGLPVDVVVIYILPGKDEDAPTSLFTYESLDYVSPGNKSSKEEPTKTGKGDAPQRMKGSRTLIEPAPKNLAEAGGTRGSTDDR